MAVDIDSRSNALRSGQFDVIHTSNADAHHPVPGRRRASRRSPRASSATRATSCSTSPRARPTRTAPTPTARCSTSTAAGPWPTPPTTSGSPRSAAPACRAGRQRPVRPRRRSATWRTAATRQYDPDEASEEMDTCLAELGTDTHRVHVQHDERPVQRRDEHADHLDVGARSSVTRSQATITPVEQGQYIGLALDGHVQRVRLAQPRRHRPGHPGLLVAAARRRRRSARWR